MFDTSRIAIPSNSSYAHQNYVQIDTPSTAQEHTNALTATRRTFEILQAQLDPQIRWAFRGYLSYACYMHEQNLYQRYTDDVDIVVDSTEFSVIDAIERVLLHNAPNEFEKALSPSKLLKIHYRCPDGFLVRLDIYNTTMRSAGSGTYHNLQINQGLCRHQLQSGPAFEMPVLTLNALIDMKLVAYLDRMQRKDLEDIFFAFWSCGLDVNAGLPWYAENVVKCSVRLSQRLDEYKEHFSVATHEMAISEMYQTNWAFLQTVEGQAASGKEIPKNSATIEAPVESTTQSAVAPDVFT